MPSTCSCQYRSTSLLCDSLFISFGDIADASLSVGDMASTSIGFEIRLMQESRSSTSSRDEVWAPCVRWCRRLGGDSWAPTTSGTIGYLSLFFFFFKQKTAYEI